MAAAPHTAIAARVAQLPSSTKRQATLAAIVVSAAVERDRAVHHTDIAEPRLNSAVLLSIPRLSVAAERQVVQLAHAARPTDFVEAQLPIAVLSAMATAVIQPAVAASVAHDMDIAVHTVLIAVSRNQPPVPKLPRSKANSRARLPSTTRPSLVRNTAPVVPSVAVR